MKRAPVFLALIMALIIAFMLPLVSAKVINNQTELTSSKMSRQSLDINDVTLEDPATTFVSDEIQGLTIVALPDGTDLFINRTTKITGSGFDVSVNNVFGVENNTDVDLYRLMLAGSHIIPKITERTLAGNVYCHALIHDGHGGVLQKTVIIDKAISASGLFAHVYTFVLDDIVSKNIYAKLQTTGKTTQATANSQEAQRHAGTSINFVMNMHRVFGTNNHLQAPGSISVMNGTITVDTNGDKIVNLTVGETDSFNGVGLSLSYDAENLEIVEDGIVGLGSINITKVTEAGILDINSFFKENEFNGTITVAFRFPDSNSDLDFKHVLVNANVAIDNLVNTVSDLLGVTLKDVPSVYSRVSNFPNPFNPTTTIEYSIPRLSYVQLAIWNIAGQKVRTLVNENQTASYKRVAWDGRNDIGETVGVGLSIDKLTAGSFTKIHKITKATAAELTTEHPAAAILKLKSKKENDANIAFVNAEATVNDAIDPTFTTFSNTLSTKQTVVRHNYQRTSFLNDLANADLAPNIAA